MKAGYPPIALEIVPELPVASLGLKRGDQIMVTQKRGTGPPIAPSAAPRAPDLPSPIRSSTVPSQNPPRTQSSLSSAVNPASPDFVETDAGVLIHRV